ncbi:MAG: YajQ family cyclic di-GMP-binding protein [bacterium]
MASTFSFDIVSDFDKAEMNNVLDQANREIDSRYDFKNTPAKLEWFSTDKNGFKITGNSDFQIDSIIEIIRKKLAARGISQKVLDESKQSATNNFQTSKEVPFKQGLDQEKAKKVTSLIRDNLPKVKTQIQGEEVRVTSAKKDELQSAMDVIRAADFDFPLNFTNFR